MTRRSLRRPIMIAGALLLLNGLTDPLSAAPLQFGTNYYDLIIVSDPYSGANNYWGAARDAAAASSYLGQFGHLATIGSQAENDFLFGLGQAMGGFTQFTGAWLGGSAGYLGYGWLVGPEAGQSFGYTNWGGTEPNNGGLAYMNIGFHPLIAPGQWADDSGAQGQPTPGSDPVIGYFVEYEGGASPVPEPGSSVLLGASLLSLALVGGNARRRRGA